MKPLFIFKFIIAPLHNYRVVEFSKNYRATSVRSLNSKFYNFVYSRIKTSGYSANDNHSKKCTTIIFIRANLQNYDMENNLINYRGEGAKINLIKCRINRLYFVFLLSLSAKAELQLNNKEIEEEAKKLFAIASRLSRFWFRWVLLNTRSS